MGCLCACFTGACKHGKRRHLMNPTQAESPKNEVSEALQLVESTKAEALEKPITESKENLEGALSCNTNKKVTFELNVKTLEEEEVAVEQLNGYDLVKGKETEHVQNLEQNREKGVIGNDLEETNKSKGSVSSKEETTKVLNHRYQNCAASESEPDEALDLEESEVNDCDDLGGDKKMSLVQEESSESLFSLSLESRKHIGEVELGEKEVSSPMPKCGANQQLKARDTGSESDVHSVLNPIENFTKWEVVSARATPPPIVYQDKENIAFCREPSFNVAIRSSKLNHSDGKEGVCGEIAVDTSLSRWLVDSEATPMSKTSDVSSGNSPSVNTRKSRRNAVEPEVGTIGSYWSHTGMIVDSDSGSSSQGMTRARSNTSEAEKVKWHSTIPLQARFDSWVEF